jgi:hypothetical protein
MSLMSPSHKNFRPTESSNSKFSPFRAARMLCSGVVGVNRMTTVSRGFQPTISPVPEYPGVALNRPVNMAREAAERLLMQFCSSFAWIENGGVLVEHMTENQWVMPMGRQQRFEYSVQSDFDFSYLPGARTTERTAGIGHNAGGTCL